MGAIANTSANLNRLQMLHFSFEAALYPLIAQKKTLTRSAFAYSTVTLFARLRGLSTSVPRATDV